MLLGGGNTLHLFLVLSSFFDFSTPSEESYSAFPSKDLFPFQPTPATHPATQKTPFL